MTKSITNICYMSKEELRSAIASHQLVVDNFAEASASLLLAMQQLRALEARVLELEAIDAEPHLLDGEDDETTMGQVIQFNRFG